MALVKRLVGLHGSTIGATEGAGTTFTICLPIGTAHLPADALEAGPVPSSSGISDPYVQEALRWLPPDSPGDTAAQLETAPAAIGSVSTLHMPAHVLVADDNTDMRDYLVRLLRGPDTRSRPSPTVAPPSKRSRQSFPTSSSAM